MGYLKLEVAISFALVVLLLTTLPKMLSEVHEEWLETAKFNEGQQVSFRSLTRQVLILKIPQSCRRRNWDCEVKVLLENGHIIWTHSKHLGIISEQS